MSTSALRGRPRPAAVLGRLGIGLGLGLCTLLAPATLGGCSPYRAAVKRVRLGRIGPEEEAVIERACRAIVCLQVQGLKQRATGVAVDEKGTVLTCWHVIRNSCSIRTRGGKTTIRPKLRGSYGGTEFGSVEVLCVLPEQDLAIVNVGIPTPHYLKPSPAGPAENARVLLFGYSSGRPAVTAGRYFGYSGKWFRKRVSLWIDAPAFNGDSGGAILNADGELVGVLTSIMTRGGLAKLRRRSKLFANVKRLTLATAVPPQVLAALLRERPVLVRAEIDVAAQTKYLKDAWDGIGVAVSKKKVGALEALTGRN
jgi:S1-C subfamily serine protease